MRARVAGLTVPSLAAKRYFKSSRAKPPGGFTDHRARVAKSWLSGPTVAARDSSAVAATRQVWFMAAPPIFVSRKKHQDVADTPDLYRSQDSTGLPSRSTQISGRQRRTLRPKLVLAGKAAERGQKTFCLSFPEEKCHLCPWTKLLPLSRPARRAGSVTTRQDREQDRRWLFELASRRLPHAGNRRALKKARLFSWLPYWLGCSSRPGLGAD